jgi:hypothetical protein
MNRHLVLQSALKLHTSATNESHLLNHHRQFETTNHPIVVSGPYRYLIPERDTVQWCVGLCSEDCLKCRPRDINLCRSSITSHDPQLPRVICNFINRRIVPPSDRDRRLHRAHVQLHDQSGRITRGHFLSEHPHAIEIIFTLIRRRY